MQTSETLSSKNSLNLNVIVFSGYKKALKTKQKTIAAFVWGQQSKCKFLSQASLQRYRRNFCKEQNIKAHHRMTLPTKRTPANVLMTVGFLFFKTGCEFDRFVSWCNLRVIWRTIWFYFDCSPLQVITNISSHITQPVKRLPLCYDVSIRSTAHQREVYTYLRLP